MIHLLAAGGSHSSAQPGTSQIRHSIRCSKINAPLEVFVEHLASIAKIFGHKITRPTRAEFPDTQPFFRFVDKALKYGCIAAEKALREIDGIPAISRTRAMKDLDRMSALKDRGLADIIDKGLVRLNQAVSRRINPPPETDLPA
jgi:hypothetical protein